jgi:hypothetical protein
MESQQRPSSEVDDLIRQRDHWKREAQKIGIAYDVAESIIAARTERLFRFQHAMEQIAGLSRSQFFSGRDHATKAMEIARDTLAKFGSPPIPEFLVKSNATATANYPCGSLGEPVESEGGGL